MKEIRGIYFGASITGGETGAPTSVACDDLGNNLHYMLSEVDSNGVVVQDADRRFQRIPLAVEKDRVRVLRGANVNPVVGPGQKLEVEVGSHKVVIEGTPDQGVLFNGKSPTRATRALENERYPKI